ncbi:MAG: hypothetical protein IT405_00020 [Candidatus Yanofskybacteria bacterium]|nr:hypothetical protein [Candidatus Yanofskybacteria bacterium]
MKLLKNRRGTGLVIGLVVLGAFAVLAASKYDLSIGRFFAAELSPSPSPSYPPPTPLPPNDARPIYVLAPKSMYVGQRQEVFVTFKNSGAHAWDVKGSPGNYANAYRIKSWGPADNTTWGLSFVPLPYAPVPPGESATFTFYVTAPWTPGTYNFQWKMNQGGVGWFGQENPPTSIIVKPLP